jgi:hypothetical protein
MPPEGGGSGPTSPIEIRLAESTGDFIGQASAI